MFNLPADDLWRDHNYRRLWFSILISSFGGHITSLALSLTSAMILQATPQEIGLLVAVGSVPYVLFMLPVGVWLDRVRKLPVYRAGETAMALVLLSCPLVWALDLMSMGFLYGIAFAAGCVSVISGTAAQIVLIQIVSRERLVAAHARNSVAGSLAEITGPAAAGALIKLVGSSLAFFANGTLLLVSVLLLRGVRVVEAPPTVRTRAFWPDLREGLRFVFGHRTLVALALIVATWQLFQTAAMVVQVLFATRVLGLNAYQYGLCFSAAGLGTVIASSLGHRLSHRIGPGPCFILGLALSGSGWLQLALSPEGGLGVVAFIAMLLCFSSGTVLIFSNMLAIRQTLTPAPLLARMTSTMRFMTLLPAGPGAVLGGFLGEHFGLRLAIGFGGVGALALALFVWRFSRVRQITTLPAA